jgi:hypothetical protein
VDCWCNNGGMTMKGLHIGGVGMCKSFVCLFWFALLFNCGWCRGFPHSPWMIQARNQSLPLVTAPGPACYLSTIYHKFEK